MDRRAPALYRLGQGIRLLGLATIDGFIIEPYRLPRLFFGLKAKHPAHPKTLVATAVADAGA